MIARRSFLGLGGGMAAGVLLPLSFPRLARAQSVPLLDATTQPKFVNQLPNPLAPSAIYQPTGIDPASGLPLYEIRASQIQHDAGLVDPMTQQRLRHTAWA